MDEVTDIYQEYLQGQDFKRRMQPKSQYRLSDECSAFYNGDQWRGLAGSDKNPTPVINIEKLIINRKIAEIRPFEVSARYRIDSLPLEHPAVPYMATVQDTLNGITQAKWNILNMTTFALERCLNAAINGMAVAHTFWDTEFEAFAADAAEKQTDGYKDQQREAQQKQKRRCHVGRSLAKQLAGSDDAARRQKQPRIPHHSARQRPPVSFAPRRLSLS